MSRQLGLPRLEELLKTIPLTIVPNGVPADVRLDLTFSPATSSIHAALKIWAETESVELESGRVRALEDFQARRRTLQPMQEADAEAFRRQIVEELKKQIDARTAAVVIASEPEGLPAVTTVREPAAPLNPPVPASPPPTATSATEPEPPKSAAKQARSRSYWWLSAPLALILALTARAVIKNLRANRSVRKQPLGRPL